ncbi:reverse transcriptase [Phytophthora megakarya]|uniref:Reverse transcriptase n=1 Tax=Phytophthora megakarya TaxID=4795 RepID=A0A225V9C3_9STRA|nr:reverse transcriptase [Phytophthora megakarya]
MINEPSSDDINAENASSETFAQILDGKTRYIYAMDSDILLQRKTYTTRTDDIDPVTVQEERRRRIATAEEVRWSILKAVLRGATTAMTYKEAREARNDNVLYYTGVSRRKVDENQPETSLRLVVPTTMIQEVLHNCHDSIEGGHQGVVRSYQRVKHDYYWIGLYADVENISSKSLPQLRGYSPGNVLAERPFQVESMDFVIPLPRSRRENTALLLVYWVRNR